MEDDSDGDNSLQPNEDVSLFEKAAIGFIPEPNVHHPVEAPHLEFFG